MDPPSRAHLPVNPIKCLCPACCASPVFRYTEQHRHECEVRYVARMASHSKRSDYLAGVAKHRGIEAAQRLRNDVWAWIREQEAMA